MSRRVTVAEEFDDDTDLPLPSRPLPNTGTRGAILEEIGGGSDDDDDEDDDEAPGLIQPGAASSLPSAQAFAKAQAQMRAQEARTVDVTPYKTWTCVYPIYLDAKRPYGVGTRRIARGKSVWWPQSKDIAEAAQRLGLRYFHQPEKAHPQDWENPGRVRVQWKKDGKTVNSAINTKKQLLESIASVIQRTKSEDNIPREPYNYTAAPATPALALPAPKSKTAAKGKQPAKGAKQPSSAPAAAAPGATTESVWQTPNGRVPQPPTPIPPLAVRVSPYSPLVPGNMLVETVKAGMTNTIPEPGAPAAGPAGAAKGKKKVIRVRQ